MFFRATWQLFRKHYDLVFSHEEASWFGTLLAKLWKIPHLYDMHSSLPQQLENFNFTGSKLVTGFFKKAERYVLRNSQSIIVICPDLLKKAKQEGAAEKTLLLENFIDFESPLSSSQEIAEMRTRYSPHGEKIVLYAGNFQPYQGIPLLIESAAKIKHRAIFLLVGGESEHIEKLKQKAESLGIGSKVQFTGQVAPSEVSFYIDLADVLVSPRISGTNTPLKIYSYLKSGKPLVATKLWTHTQILDDSIAILAEPESLSFSAAIDRALDPDQGMQVARSAKAFADKEYTYENYLEKIKKSLQIAQKMRKARGSMP
jgi:glycosyltransferase involved in cell wall biosynthesis